MKTFINWNEYPDLFQAVAEQLENLQVFDGEADHFVDAEVVTSEEKGRYGERGYIHITTNEGTFSLGLSRID